MFAAALSLVTQQEKCGVTVRSQFTANLIESHTMWRRMQVTVPKMMII